jgi:hypothetical protein
VVVGDGGHEAYTAILWGALLSRESSKVAEAETVSNVEGNTCGTAMRGAVALPWSKTASRRKGLRRNLGDLSPGRAAFRRAGPRREGRRGCSRR